MIPDKKKAVSAPTEHRSKTNITSPDSTSQNPLAGWFDLGASAKASRIERKQKRTWKRGGK